MGVTTDSIELYNSSLNSYGSFGKLTIARYYFSAVLMNDNDTIFVCGGRDLTGKQSLNFNVWNIENILFDLFS